MGANPDEYGTCISLKRVKLVYILLILNIKQFHITVDTLYLHVQFGGTLGDPAPCSPNAYSGVKINLDISFFFIEDTATSSPSITSTEMFNQNINMRI